LKLAKLVSEEYQLLNANQVLRTHRPALLGRLGNCVRKGPFAGMRYPDFSAAGSVLVPKLLGTYELELQPTIEEICARDYRHVIDVGAAEGYYAIGLGMRLPRVQITAFESDARARGLLQVMAEANGVADRMPVMGRCTRELLAQCPLGRETIMIVDCEGCEYELLDPEKLPALQACDILVELHSCGGASPRDIMGQRFATSHDIAFVDVESRGSVNDANLDGLNAAEREAILLERTGRDGWAYLRSKASA
jgi:hypothetical protein